VKVYGRTLIVLQKCRTKEHTHHISECGSEKRWKNWIFVILKMQNLIWHLRDACDRTNRPFSSLPTKPSSKTSSRRKDSPCVRLHRSTRSVRRMKEVVASAKKTFKWQSSKEGQLLKEDSFRDWMFSRPLALRPIYWEVSPDAYANFKMEYKVEINIDIFGVRWY